MAIGRSLRLVLGRAHPGARTLLLRRGPPLTTRGGPRGRLHPPLWSGAVLVPPPPAPGFAGGGGGPIPRGPGERTQPAAGARPAASGRPTLPHRRRGGGGPGWA